MSDNILPLLVFSSICKYALHYLSGKGIPSNAKKVGIVQCINLYPVKSMGCIELDQAECVNTGLISDGINDRQWIIVTADNNVFVTARSQPQLVLITPSLTPFGLILKAPGMINLCLKKGLGAKDGKIINTKVWGQQISGIDCGAEAGAWVDKVLGKPIGTHRLLYHSNELKYRELKNGYIYQKQCKIDDKVIYQDGFPFYMLSDKSVDDVCTKVKEYTGEDANVVIKQFRPNLEISGCDPYEEDKWQEVFIGDVKFSRGKQCDRCMFTTIDITKGELQKDGEPLKTLKKYRPYVRGSPALGLSLVLDRPGIISVGMPIYATY